MDDRRLGRIARALRHRLGISQAAVAARAGASQDLVSRLERGRLEGMTVGALRRVLAVFDAEAVLYVRWRGGDVDRLADRAHAELGELVVALLEGWGWVVVPEVSFSEYGERGSIDLLAWHPVRRILLVIELKSELTSIEETLRRHDSKTRLAPKVAAERFGWHPAKVTRLLVLPDARTPRRHVERHAHLFGRTYPLRSWALRRWLANPGSTAPVVAVASADAYSSSTSDARPVSTAAATSGGLLFLPSNDGVRTGRRLGIRKRINSGRAA